MKQSVNRYFLTSVVVLQIAFTAVACVPAKERTDWMDVPEYDSQATPVLPPDYSVSASIWREGIPATPIALEPQIIEYPKPSFAGSLALLDQLGCAPTSPEGYILECRDDSPLASLDCDTLSRPSELATGLDPAYPVVAECWHHDSEHDHLYFAGCLGRVGVGYVLEISDEYRVVDAFETMQELFAPIDSTQEALSYAQMTTGLAAVFGPRRDYGDTVYFQEVVEGSHATETDGGHIVHLYHEEVCGCYAFVTSQVDIIVNRDGSVEWGDAEPTYVVFRRVCVD